MLKRRKTLIATFFILLFTTTVAKLPAQTQTRKLPEAHEQAINAVTADPASSAAFSPEARSVNPGMIELSIPAIDGSHMNGIMYTAAGPGLHPTVILLHGFPGNEQNLDLAQSIRRAGWNVLYFHYRGAWGSEGSFSFSHAMQDTWSAVNFVRDPVNAVSLRIDKSNIVLVGHSMGGFMAAYAGSLGPPDSVILGNSKESAVKAVVLIAPWNIGLDAAVWTGAKEATTIKEFRGYERALHGMTAESVVAEAKQHAQTGKLNDWDMTRFVPSFKKRSVQVLLIGAEYEGGREINFFPLERELKQADTEDMKIISMPTDHPSPITALRCNRQ